MRVPDMARMYVESTAATRGEVSGDQGSVVASPYDDLTVDELSAAADRAGYRLVPLESERPSGNASREEWADFARSRGATDADLVDADGKDLTRNELRDRYGADVVTTGEAPPPGQPSDLDGGSKPEDEGPNKSGQPVTQTTSATRPSATQDSASPASESTVQPGKK
jgi:hypothetical protein